MKFGGKVLLEIEVKNLHTTTFQTGFSCKVIKTNKHINSAVTPNHAQLIYSQNQKKIMQELDEN